MDNENDENKIVITIANNIALTEFNEEKESNNNEINKTENNLKRIDTIPTCSICLDLIENNKYITQCKHIFHTTCFAQFIVKNYHKPTLYCPNCNREFKNILFKDTQNQSVIINIQNNLNNHLSDDIIRPNHLEAQQAQQAQNTRPQNMQLQQSQNRSRTSRRIEEPDECRCHTKHWCFIICILCVIVAMVLMVAKKI